MAAALATKINNYYPGTVISVIPKYYQSSNDITNYYDAAGVPQNVVITWTGPSTITTNFTQNDLQTYKAGIGNRPFMILDNTPGRKRGIYMFDNYAAGFSELYSSGCLGIKPLFRFSEYELTKIMGMSIADYMWNAEQFDANVSLNKILEKQAGASAMPHLLTFKENFMYIAGIYPVEKKVSDLQDNIEIFRLNEEDYNEIKPKIDAAWNALVQIKSTSLNAKLTRELEDKYINMLEVVKALIF